MDCCTFTDSPSEGYSLANLGRQHGEALFIQELQHFDGIFGARINTRKQHTDIKVWIVISSKLNDGQQVCHCCSIKVARTDRNNCALRKKQRRSQCNRVTPPCINHYMLKSSSELFALGKDRFPSQAGRGRARCVLWIITAPRGPACGAGLRVSIYQQSFPLFRQHHSKMYGCGGFAHPALCVHTRKDRHAIPPIRVS
ncbi:hypothetical protein D3C78_1068470 [compost metagenome]